MMNRASPRFVKFTCLMFGHNYSKRGVCLKCGNPGQRNWWSMWGMPSIYCFLLCVIVFIYLFV